MSLQSKLITIQENLKAPKNQYNSFGKYKYRNCEDILEAVKPLCAANELLLTISDCPVEVGGRVYIKATVTIKYKEEIISVDAYARESLTKKGMDEAQITGAASSYARKYALNGLFCIDDTKDADTGVKSAPVKKAAPKQNRYDEGVALIEMADTLEKLEATKNTLKEITATTSGANANKLREQYKVKEVFLTPSK